MKTCTKCEVEKPLAEFSRHPQCSDGYTTHCKACVRKKSAAWHKSNGEALNKSRRAAFRTPIGKARSIYSTMRLSCKKNGWADPEFSVEEILDIISEGRCAITAIPFEVENNYASLRNPFAPSPDRIDNSLGYTKDNVQWVIWMFNQMKSDYSPLALSQFIKGIRNASCLSGC